MGLIKCIQIHLHLLLVVLICIPFLFNTVFVFFICFFWLLTLNNFVSFHSFRTSVIKICIVYIKKFKFWSTFVDDITSNNGQITVDQLYLALFLFYFFKLFAHFAMHITCICSHPTTSKRTLTNLTNLF